MSQRDRIFLKGVRVPTFIGVPDEERSQAQSVTIDLTVYPSGSMKSLDERIEQTIDYGQVAAKVFQVASARPRKLIETLAEDLAMAIFEDFDVAALDVKIAKQILPGMESAGLEMHFAREDV